MTVTRTPVTQARTLKALLIALTAMLSAMPSPPQVSAQERAPGAGAVESIQVRPNVYVIFGGGGNIVMHVGEDGIILIDSGSAAMAEQVVLEIRRITKAPIRLIINTSADADHIGGNERISRERAQSQCQCIHLGCRACWPMKMCSTG